MARIFHNTTNSHSQQEHDARLWRGSLLVSGMQTSPEDAYMTKIQVTAVEADGNNQQHLWPGELFFHIDHRRQVLGDFREWVNRHAQPLCTFISECHRDANDNARNQATFRSLSRFLSTNQTIATAPWGTGELHGAGIIIYPAANSSSLLVGALFLTTAFPPLVLGKPPLRMPLPPFREILSGIPELQLAACSPSSVSHGISQSPAVTSSMSNLQGRQIPNRSDGGISPLRQIPPNRRLLSPLHVPDKTTAPNQRKQRSDQLPDSVMVETCNKTSHSLSRILCSYEQPRRG